VKFLLDTQVLLWSIFGTRRLTPRVRQVLEDDASELFVSVVSIWELAIKVGIGKLNLPGSSTRYVLEQLDHIGTAILPVEPAHILWLETLPRYAHHKDPWDRMLIVQAIEENLTILSADSKFPLYDVPLVWK
jgi:PIN domain nuclease of toxin-antitoxin system